jgi:hypothetical protein
MINKALSVIFLIFLILLYLFVNQQKLIYPGMSREIDVSHPILKEPFEMINTSYYKKGKTGKLWLILGGNRSLPSDFTDYIGESTNSILMITYPGYNKTELKPNLETINLTIDNCIKKLNIKGYNNNDINFICHSIGCAAAINYLANKKIEIGKLVLLAPFSNISQVIYDKYMIPKFLINKLIDHMWDNQKIIDVHKSIEIVIIHGKHDKYLCELRGCNLEITDDDHNSIKRFIPTFINN